MARWGKDRIIMNRSFFYTYQKRCMIPAAILRDLREKIKNSDFLVTDDKGVHRLVGLKFCEKTDLAPSITFICMRHEMVCAKQIAFSFGKKIYYSSDYSAKLFSYSKGDVLLQSDYHEAAKLYCHHIEEKARNKDFDENVIRVSNSGLQIQGHLLKPFFRLNELIWIIGEPDEREWLYIQEKSVEVCSWNKIGLSTISKFWDKNHIKGFYICKKEIKDKKIKPFQGNLYINEKTFEEKKADGIYGYFEIGRDALAVTARKNEKLELCENDEADFIGIEFYKQISLAVTGNQVECLQELIKKRHVKNCTDNYNKEPLLTVAITNNFSEIVKILIDAGADLNKPSKWGITPLMRAVIGEKTEFVRMLLNAGAAPNVRCKEGFSALDYAKMHQVKLEIIEMLEEADEK